MTSEVGSGQVAIFPTFKGFRRAVDAEVDGSAKSGRAKFSASFRSAGTESGQSFAQGFKSSGSIDGILKASSASVARAAREVSAARLKEQDAAGKVRVAETQLADARARFESGSVQVVRAEERLASAERSLAATQENTRSASERLAVAKRDLAAASDQAASAGSRMQGTFSRLPGILGSSGAESARRFSRGFLDVLGGALGANILTGVGFAIGRGINRGIRLGIGYAFDGVALASDLEQSTGAVESVFKGQAQFIESWAQGAVKNVGLTRSAYKAFATLVGAQLKNLRIPFDQVSGKTDKLITLGADLAAQFGGSTSDAVQALSSLLRGERDPIERYGVSIKQADINARLASQGLKGLTGDALRQAEIQATLAILWEQTADAQGTFFRETDTYAHQQQVLNAALEETQTKFGEFLLPAFTKTAVYANDELIPRLDGVIDRVGPRLAASLKQASPAMDRLLDKAEPLVEEFLIWGGEEGLPAVIDFMSDFADNAPGWVAAFKSVGDAVAWVNDGFGTNGFGTGQSLSIFDLPSTLQSMWDTVFKLDRNGISEGLYSDLDWILGPQLTQKLRDAGKLNANQFAAGFATADGWARIREATKKGINDGVVVPARELSKDFPTIGQQAMDEFNEALRTGGAQAAAESWGIKFGIEGPIKRLTEEAGGLGWTFGDLLAAGIESKRPKAGLAGANFGDALAAGIKSKEVKIGLAGFNAGQAAVQGAKRGMRIASPSKEGLEIGSNFVGSIGSGIDAEVASTVRSAERMADAVARAASITGESAVRASAAAAGVLPDSDRPIFMDGVPVGWLRQVNGVARLVFDEKWDAKRSEVLAGGAV